MIRVALVLLCTLPTLVMAITPAAERPKHYLPLLADKQVAVVVNHTARVNDAHLLDVLLHNDIKVSAVMSPEHGFRGTAAAGEKIADGRDTKTGLPVYSLYGSNKKPTRDMLQGIDVIVFDLQDVGTRFYTYLSTLHYVLEAAAENDVGVIVLDRPNPHIGEIDGPVLSADYRSFVGLHPIPVLHGMTLGELAKMIKGEGWIAQAQALNLTVIPVGNYTRDMHYTLPMAPSPNLPTANAIALYPTLCFFEGTAVSIGRGTDTPFELIGHDQVTLGDASILVTGNDAAPAAKLKGQVLHARRLTGQHRQGIDLALLLDTYQRFQDANVPFFTRPAFFDKLAGSAQLREAMQEGQSVDTIRAAWQAPLAAFMSARAPYLIYPSRAHDDQ